MTRTRIDKVLVANRGEIACRVLRSLREMGIASVAVYSDADAYAPHVREADEAVRIGPAPSAESYLAGARIVEAALAIGADAIHPGYGFLSENAAFAARCGAAGLVFIGPSVDAIRRMGSKIEAKAIMAAADVPVIPGFAAEGLAATEIARRADELGYPVLVKASAGGGGKGMRVVRDRAGLEAAISAARREAESAFGDGTLLVERYFEAPRHVEIQIFGDQHGDVIHCFERECSVQRRHQKVVEEAPSPAVDDSLRARMGAAAVAAGRAIGYVGAGTVEFVLDSSGRFHFLEVNTRLQVEHPVTEAVTGLDLVRMQIEVARGERLSVRQEDLAIRGHAIEVRLYAEDPARDFLPATGRIALWQPPGLPGLRLDSGVEVGSEVGIHYDPMLAKLIAHGTHREEARQRLLRGLTQLGVGGVVTNRDFLMRVLEHEAFAAGDIDTHFIERHMPGAARSPGPTLAAIECAAVAAVLFEHELRRESAGPLSPSLPSGWRNNRWRPQEQRYRVAGEEIEVRYVAGMGGGFRVGFEDGPLRDARILERDATAIAVEFDGVLRRYGIAREAARLWVHAPAGTIELEAVPRFPPPRAAALAGGCAAPMTGVIRKLCVAEGDRVEEGSLLLVLEAMKMEHQVLAHAAGVVRELRVREGQMVDPDEVLVVITESEAGGGAPA